MNADKSKQKIVLIDGHSILHRAFYGMPDLTNAKGFHTGAIYGFLTIMQSILDEEQPDYLVVAFDVHAPTFRHEMYEAYKGTRKPMPPELREQVPVLKELLRAMQVTTIEEEGFEADDILGTIAGRCKKEGVFVALVSGDRDLLQISDEDVMIRIPKTKNHQTIIENYLPKDVVDAYSLTPSQIIDLKALMGDNSDNIPGVPGIGEKTATKLLLEYGTLNGVYDHLDEVKPPRIQGLLRDHKEQAELSYKLATINTQAPINFDLDQARLADFATPKAYEMFRDLEFKRFLERYDGKKPVAKEEAFTFSVIKTEREREKLAKATATDGAISVLLDPNEQEVLPLFADANAPQGIAVALSKGGAYYLPVEGDFTFEKAREYVLDLAKDARVFVFDLQELLREIAIPEETSVCDVKLMAYEMDPLRSEYTIDALAPAYLNSHLPEDGEKKEMAARRADVLVRAGSAVLDAIKESGMEEVLLTIDQPLAYALRAMEDVGVLVDQKELSDYSRELGEKAKEIEASIYEKAGESFNIQSPKQLGVILFEKLGLPAGKKTKTGYSTAADVLEKLAPNYPIVKEILRYRTLTKLKSTYADGLQNFIEEDGRIRGHFHQTITATGRISSTEPNLQNIPIRTEEGRRLRRAFYPEDGCCFLDADYSQIELRILAALSGDENLIRAFAEGADIHAWTASQVFHVPLEEVDASLRRKAKAVNFGIVYGISAFGLGEDLDISRKEADDYIKSYFESYPKIKEFLDAQVAFAKEHGYVTTHYGRRRPIPEIRSSNFAQRSFGERAAMNSPIQGTAADLMKMAMYRVYRRLKEEGLSSRIVLQVHDELLVETRMEEKDAVKQILEEEMTKVASLGVNLEAEVSEGMNWLEAH